MNNIVFRALLLGFLVFLVFMVLNIMNRPDKDQSQLGTDEYPTVNVAAKGDPLVPICPVGVAYDLCK